MILNIQPLIDTPSVSFPGPGLDVLPPTAPPSLTFHGAKPPVQEIQKEKAIHRTAAYMMASGAKIKTIAFELNVAEATVSNWSRQPWFQSLVSTIIHNEFSGDITKMLKTAAVEAVIVQQDLMHNSVSDQVRLKAAQDLLDRYRGKPTNFVHHTNGAISEDPAEELKRLEQELLEEKQK